MGGELPSRTNGIYTCTSMHMYMCFHDRIDHICYACVCFSRGDLIHILTFIPHAPHAQLADVCDISKGGPPKRLVPHTSLFLGALRCFGEGGSFMDRIAFVLVLCYTVLCNLIHAMCERPLYATCQPHRLPLHNHHLHSVPRNM